jgi:hypothetical protein
LFPAVERKAAHVGDEVGVPNVPVLDLIGLALAGIALGIGVEAVVE